MEIECRTFSIYKWMYEGVRQWWSFRNLLYGRGRKVVQSCIMAGSFFLITSGSSRGYIVSLLIYLFAHTIVGCRGY